MGRHQKGCDSDEIYNPWEGKIERQSNDVKKIFDEMDEDLS